MVMKQSSTISLQKHIQKKMFPVFYETYLKAERFFACQERLGLSEAIIYLSQNTGMRRINKRSKFHL